MKKCPKCKKMLYELENGLTCISCGYIEEKKTRVSLSTTDLDDLIDVISAYQDGYEHEEHYLQLSKLGRKLERANAKLLGEEWSEEYSRFTLKYDAELQKSYWSR